MNSTDVNESRHFLRIPFHTDVQLHFYPEDEVQTARLLDISLRGALVKTGQPIVKSFNGRICSMTLALGNNGENITMEARVVHQEQQVIGIECRRIDLDSMTNLRRLIELNTGDEGLLERELDEMLKIASL